MPVTASTASLDFIASLLRQINTCRPVSVFLDLFEFTPGAIDSCALDRVFDILDFSDRSEFHPSQPSCFMKGVERRLRLLEDDEVVQFSVG